MANFLADVGRSKVGAVGRDLLQKAVDIRSGERDMAAQNLGMAIDIERFKQEREQNELQLDALRAQQAERQKQQEFLNYKIPMPSINYTLKRGGMPNEAVDYVINEARNNDLIKLDEKGNEYITRQDALFMRQRFAEDVEFQEKLFASTIQGLEREAQELQAALTDPEKPLKGKEAEAAQERLDLLMAPEGPIATGYNFMQNALPEKKAAEKIAENPQLFTPTAEQAATFKLDPNKQYMGYYDKSGNLRTVLREANEEDLGVDTGGGTDRRDKQIAAGERSIYMNFGASDLSGISRESRPSAQAMVHRMRQLFDTGGYSGVEAANEAQIEFDLVPKKIENTKKEYNDPNSEKGKKLRAQYPTVEKLNAALKAHVESKWGRIDAWGRDIPGI